MVSFSVFSSRIHIISITLGLLMMMIQAAPVDSSAATIKSNVCVPIFNDGSFECTNNSVSCESGDSGVLFRYPFKYGCLSEDYNQLCYNPGDETCSCIELVRFNYNCVGVPVPPNPYMSVSFCFSGTSCTTIPTDSQYYHCTAAVTEPGNCPFGNKRHLLAQSARTKIQQQEQQENEDDHSDDNGQDDDEEANQNNMMTKVLDACGHLEYQASIQVLESHLYAIAWPKTNKKDDSDDDAAGCPTMLATHAILEQQHPTTRTVPPARKELLIWHGGSMNDKDEEQNEEESHPPPSFLAQDSLFIGTFRLKQLAAAYKVAKPDNGAAAGGVYDIVTNNCAVYLVQMAAALGVKIDRRITSFVTRRLVEQAGNDLVRKIRASLNYWSLFGTGGGGGRRDYNEDEDEHNMRLLLRGGGDGIQEDSNKSRQDVVVSDEKLIELLVRKHVSVLDNE